MEKLEPEDDRRQYSDDDRSQVCFCGKLKGKRNFFCADCYDLLPDTYAIGLYRPGILGQKTYELCISFLDKYKPVEWPEEIEL